MRRATCDTQWLVDDNSQFCGLALGHDFCAEHEWGAPVIKDMLGIATANPEPGLAGRLMTQVPPTLKMDTYTARSADRRIKRTMPAALLYCPPYVGGWAAMTTQELIRAWDVAFYTDFAKDKWHKPEDDLVCAWSSEGGFAVHARGEENVARLHALYAAFQAKDIAMADGSINGFIRKPRCFVVASTVSVERRAALLEADLDHRRMLQMAQDTGIEAYLREHGKRWHALAPRWADESKSAVVFWLNPMEQKKYNFGWFTVEQLREWAHDKGPVTVKEKTHA